MRRFASGPLIAQLLSCSRVTANERLRAGRYRQAIKRGRIAYADLAVVERVERVGFTENQIALAAAGRPDRILIVPETEVAWHGKEICREPNSTPRVKRTRPPPRKLPSSMPHASAHCLPTTTPRPRNYSARLKPSALSLRGTPTRSSCWKARPRKKGARRCSVITRRSSIVSQKRWMIRMSI